jgi:two-component system alkaline phosphatase synthesis response regulator PhoP
MQKQTKTLIVDDDPDLVAAAKAVLESKSYQVVAAFDGDEGLQKVVEERPDLIVLDVIMPGKDGFTVCRELKTDPRYYFFSKIPVLMLTVYPDDREKARLSLREGMIMEAEDYLQKPMEPEELLSRVEDLLRK